MNVPPPHMRILPHVDLSEQGLRELEIWLRQRPGTSDTEHTLWAAVGFSGYTEIQTGGGAAGLGDGEFVTNAPNTFSLREFDPGANPNYFGLDIFTDSFYKCEFMLQMYDVAGHRVPTPEVELAICDNGGGNSDYEVNLLGSNYTYGFEKAGGIGEWDIAWSKILHFDGTPNLLFSPIYFSIVQLTGETLWAYTNLFIHSIPGGSS